MGNYSFYQDEPLFGLDFGHAGLKVMQLTAAPGKMSQVLGYGFGAYPPDSIKDGVIVSPDSVADALRRTLESGLVGRITAKRIACALPTSHTFSRPMRLPAMEDENIAEAVKLEAEQYIPIPVDSLYMDYDVYRRDARHIDLMMVAAHRNIVDSYLNLFNGLGLEPIAFEPGINSASRIFGLDEAARNGPSILIDIGALTMDIAIFTGGIFVNSTVDGGGDTLAEAIAKKMGLTIAEAHKYKREYGLSYSDKQLQLTTAMDPVLENLVHEVRKIVRYYAEQPSSDKKPIRQLIIMGGGANIPGLDQYLARELRLPARPMNPWRSLDFGGIHPLSQNDRTRFITAAGVAMLSPKEVFA